ncbi:MAG: peptide deformylase [Candidatus Kerfeldbacteria bacterium RIFOXYA2_FULL_38_24]|uniref:Peptide deformylase n=1 Tax=Candidatus Kerfeldbacteria bacterium RIFOXYB2_FULL_38_14 TaxID=1798547 RepID=A0A1G2BB09_9BACT|nr:MAG: peptide deformylase [Candidatus Kerfeldbacteria bacterium RIFOXYB2_FULL_38_14]OGY87532.1 MAG: peptide deformylase [Candidatus Kerfeldbacteria bacterium RIFOXYA2_FULL_38_24]OGY89235.1 MAG: peptide deformylase [Candidatus Kerfeldbacteria bacterium RIFOXYC2_FULL_38_9]
MALKIYTLNEPEIRKISSDVAPQKISEKNLQVFMSALAKMMHQHDGIGIAAPQVGKNIRLIVIDKDYAKTADDLVLVNPRVVSIAKKTNIQEEGCLSVPGVYGLVERPVKARVKGWGRQGEKMDIKAKGMLARVLQHEIDHLNGILFIDKAVKIKKNENAVKSLLV